MIYDCFTFFNELDLLEIRLNIMNNYVDKFVLVEATKTFTGKDKPLYFDDNKDRFSKFNDKIIHVILDEYPNIDSAWANECAQRNAISKGLSDCKDEDIIIISDLDEIPYPKFIEKYKDIQGIKLFEINTYYYYLNCKLNKQGVWLLGPKMLSYKDFKNYTDDKQEDVPYGEHLLKELNQGTTPSTIRYFRHPYHIKNSGWHFSYLGGAEAVLKKYQSFSHTECNTKENNDIKQLVRNIEQHKGFSVIPIDDTFPKYIVENQKKYSSYIKSVNKIEYYKYLIYKGFRKIFDIKNEYSNYTKRKVLTIFCFKIKFKRKQG